MRIKAFSEMGVVKINRSFEGLSDYVNQNYISKIHNNEKPIYEVYDSPHQKDENIQIQAFVSLNDAELQKFIFNKKIIGLLKSYLGTEYFLRENPAIQEVTAKKEDIFAYRFHTDRLHQISLMLFLTDVTKETTHMEYLVGSHKRKPLEKIHITEDECDKKQDNFKRCYLTGKRETHIYLIASGFTEQTIW